MFGLFRKKWTIEETSKAFPLFERSVKVCLYTMLKNELVAGGFADGASGIISAQGVNYITGEHWESAVDGASAEIKLVVEAHKSAIEPAARALLAKDESCRKIVTYFLRIKAVLLAAQYGFEVWAKDPMKGRIEKLLSMYGQEFPEEVDPGKFGAMVLNFQRKVFPQKHV